MRILTTILEDLRRTKAIKSYKVDIDVEDHDNKRSECIITLNINGDVILKRTKLFNKQISKISSVTDMLLKELHDQLLGMGIMAIYSNRTQLVN